MIAIESFKKYHLQDIVAITLLALFWAGLSYLFDATLDPQISFLVTLITITILMSFTVHLIRKAGAATLFFGLCAIFTISLTEFGVTGFRKFLALVIAGIVFELAYLILKLELKNIQLDIILGTGLSAAMIPLVMALQLSFTISVEKFIPLLNIIIVSFIVGLIGALISFLIWYKVKSLKPIVRFEYHH